MGNNLGESKVLQYFGNTRHNSITQDTFVKIMKVTNHSGLSDAELTLYSPSVTH